MKELTGNDLRRYAEQSGLRIMPHRNADEWAERINAAGGECPCGKQCPCSECTCKFFEPLTHTNMRNAEFKSAVKTLEHAKKILFELNPSDDENAAEKVEKIAKMMKEEADKHDCSVCSSYIESMARKLNFLADECKLDGDECSRERNYTIMKADEIIEIFVGADNIMEEKGNTEKSAETPSTLSIEEVVKEEPKERSAYHTCVSEEMKGELIELPKPQRLCTAVKMCGSNTKMTKEEAMAACGIETHNEEVKEGAREITTVEDNTVTE